MRFSTSALFIALFATSAICAPVASHEIDSITESSIIARAPPTRASITAAYKTAESAAQAALKAADDLRFDIGMKPATAAQKSQLTSLLKTAWSKGHDAEKYRGDYTQAFPQDADDGHMQAIEWIDSNIMQPTQNMAQFFKITL